jgi:hypothetical protein
MKTTKLIFALTLAVIFSLGITNMFAQRNLRTDIPVERKARMVKYVVRIANAEVVKNLNAHYLIVMTDEAGNLVAPSQTFRPGVSDYTFFEGGTVRGTRTAKMMRIPVSPNSMPVPSASQTGIFYGGGSYLFIINPFPATIDAGSDLN